MSHPIAGGQQQKSKQVIEDPQSKTNKRNAKRKYLRMAKLVTEGKLDKETFDNSYTAWKNHSSHGNCYKLGKVTDNKILDVLKETE